MAQPIHHTASSAVAETANSGLIRGTLGAIAGGVLATAVMAGGAALLAGVLIGGPMPAALGWTITSTAGGAVGYGAAILGGIATWITPVGITAAAIGGGAGALGGIAKTTDQIHQENMAAKNVGRGHDMQLMQQMSNVRQQAAEQYIAVGYEQGSKDAEEMIRQKLAQVQERPHFIEKILQEHGAQGGVQQADASHLDRAKASKEQAGEYAQGA